MSSEAGTILAAGTVIRRAGATGPEVLLVHRPRYDDWSFPKGKLDREEHVLLAAVRETEEETGLRVRLERDLPTQHYSVSGRPKTVHYWAATPTGGSFVPNDEVDVVEWLALEAAKERLSWRRDETLVDALAQGVSSTSAVLVLRHGSAVPPAEWNGDDDARPLTASGVAQSALLAALLATYVPERVMCSDTVRTLETVRAFAEAANLTVEVTPLLGKRGSASAGAAARQQADAVRTADVPVLLCTHREVVSTLVKALAGTSRARPPTGELAPGDFFVLHFSDGVLASSEHHRLP